MSLAFGRLFIIQPDCRGATWNVSAPAHQQNPQPQTGDTADLQAEAVDAS
jgi:hypothetical protein